MIDDALTVKLVDFGAAKDKMSSHTALGSTIVGTYGYMAPEQFKDKRVRKGIYAVGPRSFIVSQVRRPQIYLIRE